MVEGKPTRKEQTQVRCRLVHSFSGTHQFGEYPGDGWGYFVIQFPSVIHRNEFMEAWVTPVIAEVFPTCDLDRLDDVTVALAYELGV